MEADKILQADILDIIFEGKNKSYGAYQLRKDYSRTLSKSLLSTGGFLILVFIGTALVGSGHKDNTITVSGEVELGKLEKEVIPPPVVPLKPITPVQNQVAYAKPVIVSNAVETQRIETIEDNQQISTQTIKSDNTDPVVQAPVTDNSQVVNLPLKQEDEDKTWTDVQVHASFPGGFNAWKKYLEKNLDPETPVNNAAPAGTYTVIINFIVSRDGSISNVEAATKFGYGMEAEAIKIISTGPKWVPAMQNGHQVNAYHRQPITFVVNEN